MAESDIQASGHATPEQSQQAVSAVPGGIVDAVWAAAIILGRPSEHQELLAIGMGKSKEEALGRAMSLHEAGDYITATITACTELGAA